MMPAADSAATSITRVAAAVILRPDGAVLLAQRPPGKPYAGYWEFPGGKLEPGESPRQALDRELHEELGLIVRHAAPWLVQAFVYPHAHVELHFFRVFAWDGEPHGHDGQAFAWQFPGRFAVEPLLPANTRVLAALTLPPICGITCAADVGEAAFLARAAAAFRQGLRLVQVRETSWPAERRNAFALQLRAIAPADATLLLNGEADDARAPGFAGVHWTSAALMQARARPPDLMVSASCHDATQLARAGALGVDFALLGPVQATPTHPAATPLGFARFAAIAAATRVPVYALGGLAAEDLHTAIDAGAHGLALRRHAWPART
jgi:8-oxo-dGTP diphosphatase